jgi:hypothetical protein
MLEGARIANATSKRAGAQTAFTMQRLWRQAVWGCIAAVALLLAIVAGFTDAGSRRATLLVSSLNGAPSSSLQTAQTQAPSPNQPASRSLDSDYVVRQLAQTVRGLMEDRDRMAKRLAAVERNVDDMTGSISQQIEAVKAPTASPAVSWLATATTPLIAAPYRLPLSGWDTAPRPNSSPPSSSPPSSSPPAAVQPPPDAAAANGAYGAEIGSASSVKALHARWEGIRSAHLQIFDGLTPVVALRENPRSHKTELRLVVGPLGNAAAAAQLCASLMAVQLSCLPTMFDGHNLALE